MTLSYRQWWFRFVISFYIFMTSLVLTLVWFGIAASYGNQHDAPIDFQNGNFWIVATILIVLVAVSLVLSMICSLKASSAIDETLSLRKNGEK